MKKEHLELLNSTELLCLQKHIKLGKEHLKSLLEPAEVKELLRLGEVDSQTKETLQADLGEMSANSTLVFNTILTATLGTWMGLSGFMGLPLNSIFWLSALLLFSFSVGGFIGFQNVQFTKKNVQKAIENKKFQTIEILCLDTVNHRKVNELHVKTQRLQKILHSLSLEESSTEQMLEDPKIGLKWADLLIKNLQAENKSNNKEKIDEIERIKNQFEWMEVDQSRKSKEMEKILDSLGDASIQPSLPASSWIETNFRSLLVTLIPTLFGGFSSLFVYLGGAPNIAKEMGKHDLFNFLTKPEVKIVQLILAIITTLYFGYSFLHMSRKNFQRDQALAKGRTVVIRKENALTILDDRLLIIKALHDTMLRISDICRLC